MLRTIKDKLYYYFAGKNWGVRREYGPYVDAHQEEHAKQPWKHWWLLIRLNWHYRVLRRETRLLEQRPNKAINKNRRLPFLDGPESGSFRRTLPIHLAMQLMPYDVISFDIFDTLLLRPFAKPTDLFYIVGNRLDMPEFYQLRIDAEKRAREIAIAKTGSREITIYDIYALIERKTGISKEKGVETEFEVELQYCLANPYMKRVFQMLQEQGKTIVITSDMYLPHDMMKQLLEKNGYSGFEKLYVSCDYGCNKHQKGLYKYLLRDFRNKNIVHVGDNRIADIKCAEECGINTKYYQGVHGMGNPYRPDGMGELVGGAYAGVVNIHLHNGIKIYSPYYEYGFTYGGLYIFGFCHWIYQKARREGVEKVLFLSRDGAIYKKVFSNLFPDMPTEYVLWSRIADTKYTFAWNRFMSFDSVFQGRVSAKEPYSVGGIFDSIGLGRLKKYLPDYGLTEQTLITQDCMQKIEQMFFEHGNDILEAYAIQKEYKNRDIQEKVGSASKVAIVDVGWRGSGPRGIKHIIERELELKCHAFGWMAAVVSSPKVNISTCLADGSLEAYIFSKTYNRNLFDTHIKTNRGLNHVFFEMFTQDCSPSYSGMTDDGKHVFELPEVENYKFIKEIQQGILDFCMLYSETFKYDPYLYNIPGYDAYLPFRVAARDVAFWKNNLGEFTFSRIIGDGNNEEKKKTILDLIKDANY